MEPELELNLVANWDAIAPNLWKLRLQSPRLCDCPVVGGSFSPASALIEVDRGGIVVRRDQPHPPTGSCPCHRFGRFQESRRSTSALCDSEENDYLTLVIAEIIEQNANGQSILEGNDTRELVGVVQDTPRDDPRRSKMRREQIADPHLVFWSDPANVHRRSLSGT
jgi:hypothetical protein